MMAHVSVHSQLAQGRMAQQRGIVRSSSLESILEAEIKGGARKGEIAFQVTPKVTHLFPPCPTS